jgi:enamine deaminase RidA (YjgF/YER057c/UK114 family)
VVGFSAAVRSGNLVYVAGTVGRAADGTFAPDVYRQTRQALANIATALDAAGASLRDVVRTRMFVTDINQWQESARAHREVFGDVMPASTLVEVNRLAAPEMLIEIEVDAVVDP